MSGISLFNIARDSLLSHQTAINVTGTNVANVNTAGYTRQTALFQPSKAVIHEGAVQYQSGVYIDDIVRTYDRFLQAQINDNINTLGYSESRKESLERIEIMFNETSGGGLDELLTKFWNAWDDCAVNPAGSAERTAVVSAAESLTYMFNTYAENLASIQQDANGEIADSINSINSIIRDIADINEKIIRVLPGTGGRNDLLDTREQLISDLSEMVDINVVEDENETITVFLANGMPLVENQQISELSVVANEENNSFYDVVFANDTDRVLNDVFNGGRLKGLLEIRDTDVPAYMEKLDTLAATVADEVNSRHQTGYDMYGNVGGDFFTFNITPEATEARYIAVNDDILNDINMIAASETMDGDGNNAATIGSLRDDLVMNGNTTTLNGFYASFVAEIGQDSADMIRSYDYQYSLKSQLTNKREQISGVSIDEEMINLMKYQMGYQAAAKLGSAAEEMSDILMTLVQ